MPPTLSRLATPEPVTAVRLSSRSHTASPSESPPSPPRFSVEETGSPSVLPNAPLSTEEAGRRLQKRVHLLEALERNKQREKNLMPSHRASAHKVSPVPSEAKRPAAPHRSLSYTRSGRAVMRLEDQVCLQEPQHLQHRSQSSWQKPKETILGVMTVTCCITWTRLGRASGNTGLKTKTSVFLLSCSLSSSKYFTCASAAPLCHNNMKCC